MAKKNIDQKKMGPGFNYSKENDQYIDELMVENPDRLFYPKFVYNLACLACTYALSKNLAPGDFVPKSSTTHKINADQLSNPEVDFILKIIGYYYSKNYKILDKVDDYRRICEKYSNTGMTALYDFLKMEDFPNSSLIRLIKKDEEI